MKHRISKILEFKTPPDGMTDEEKKIEKVLGDATIQVMYSKLPTARMKAITALHFELGYKQEVVAEIFGISQPAIVQELNVIRAILMGKRHRPHTNAMKLSVEDLLNIIAKYQYN